MAHRAQRNFNCSKSVDKGRGGAHVHVGWGTAKLNLGPLWETFLFMTLNSIKAE